MTPSLIILIDESATLQKKTWQQAYGSQIPVAVVNDIPGIKKYRSQAEATVIIATRFVANKLLYREQVLRFMPHSKVFVFSDQTDIKVCRSAIDIYGCSRTIIPDLIVQYILENNDSKGPGLSFPPSLTHVKGTSPVMIDLYDTIAAVAPTNFNVIIYGETGTGKEAFARLIHESSRRSRQPFVTIDCGCLNRETALSELFGHVKGAFTDAVADKTGAFEQANGGTLFLDELANLPYDVQVAMLRAVQEHEIRKLGAVDSMACDVRIIAATNDQLAARDFRRDLYYRLNEMSLHLPPLSERGTDILTLATFFLDEICRELNAGHKIFSDCARKAILEHSWPGNVRELKNVVKRSCLMAFCCEMLTADMLQIDDLNTERIAVNQRDALKETVQRAEYDQIIATLRSVQFNKRKAAALLNIHRKTLYNKLKYMKEVFN